MTIRISATHSSRLPKLGWLAAIDFPARVVSVVCGQGVEASDDFVVEGVWDGPFHEGGFHRASHFFGSGLRIDGERVFIIPSHALVDRVLLAWRGDITLASNSLLLLLAATGDSLDPSLDYRHACNAITAGVRKYDPLIPLGDAGPGPVRQGFRVPQVLGQEDGRLRVENIHSFRSHRGDRRPERDRPRETHGPGVGIHCCLRCPGL